MLSSLEGKHDTSVIPVEGAYLRIEKDGIIRPLHPTRDLGLTYTVPAAFWVALIMGLVFTLLIAWPWIEKKFTGDDAHHNLLQRPRDVPVRTAIGAMAIAFYMVLTLAAMNDIIALKFDISLNATTWIGRIGMVVLPAIVYYLTYRLRFPRKRGGIDNRGRDARETQEVRPGVP